ncbi:MAG: RsmB/NOP family class I SAM-dependent RNA methyltransferase [Candidatus Thermoplasmatota archaeon]|nr:RsmB/NOP family class I SAM-dependent RNA methyltransferase [Candidatus Thermoplasmatota archaeon]
MVAMEKKIAVQIIRKYLKKGNMARCLRDILPSAGLSKDQRQQIADIVHTVVRWRRLYEHIIDSRGLSPAAETYLQLALDGAQSDAVSYPFEYRYSCSSYVAGILKDHAEWAEILNETPPTTLCINFNRTTSTELIALLQQESLPMEQGILPTALHTTSVSKYSKVIQHRYAHVQDESSQLVSHIAVFLGDSIYDMCAGNGGKSLAMASMVKNGKNMHAYEKNDEKRRTLKRRCDEYDASVIVENHPSDASFDVVLVDAPCSGLGAARRNPEAKYVDGVGMYPQTQMTLLRQAAQNLKPKGHLIYAVCTITPEETEQVIHNFMQQTGFTLVPYENVLYGKYLQRNDFGLFLRVSRGDLFFLSVLRKT